MTLSGRSFSDVNDGLECIMIMNKTSGILPSSCSLHLCYCHCYRKRQLNFQSAAVESPDAGFRRQVAPKANAVLTLLLRQQSNQRSKTRHQTTYWVPQRLGSWWFRRASRIIVATSALLRAFRISFCRDNAVLHTPKSEATERKWCLFDRSMRHTIDFDAAIDGNGRQERCRLFRTFTTRGSGWSIIENARWVSRALQWTPNP